MPDTARLRLAEIADWDNVAWAAARACRGKRGQPGVRVFLDESDRHIADIAAALRAGRLPVGRFQAFEIHDPKRRLIHAAPLADRIAHHALIRHMEPRLERALLPSVYACRVGKGVHAAVHAAQRNAQRFAWVMHLDIAAYFPSVDHDVLRAQLARRFRGDGLALVDAVLAAHGAECGKGLPIGALTSQHFANHYLDTADRWCLAQPEVRAHVRYMDDFLLWGDDREGLRRVRDRLLDFLDASLRLSAKPALIQRSDRGIRFCGMHVKPNGLRASARRRRRYRQAVAHWQAEWSAGRLDDLGLQRAYDAARAILLPADDIVWRRQCLRVDGAPDV